jgi:hypothetical protein
MARFGLWSQSAPSLNDGEVEKGWEEVDSPDGTLYSKFDFERVDCEDR